MTETAFTHMTTYITQRTSTEGPLAEAFEHALQDADENGLRVPSPIVGSLLSTLAATGVDSDSGAVAVTPAAGSVGLHILRGLPAKATLTCIEPEAALQAGAKETFKLGGFTTSRARFLTARPLDVIGRLAADAYRLIYADVAPVELSALIDNAWPLLTRGGTLVIASSLLDGTLADPTRRDRDTDAARAADEKVEVLEREQGAVVTRLPLDGGLTLVTKR